LRDKEDSLIPSRPLSLSLSFLGFTRTLLNKPIKRNTKKEDIHGTNKEEFDELVAEIKKLKGVVLKQEKKMEVLETRIKDFDSLIKEATTFKLANGNREDGQDSEQDA